MYPMLGTVLTKAQKSISSLALAEETHRPSKAATTMRMAAYRVDKPTLRQSRIAGSDLDHADTSSSTCVAGEWRPRVAPPDRAGAHCAGTILVKSLASALVRRAFCSS
jgi:hypothetical protein